MAERAVRVRRFKRVKVHGEACLNCGAAVSTPYCPHCGQENIPCDLSLGAVLKELFAEVAYYDSKLWHTLWTLISNPGRLTADWSDGRRAHYITPVRLYLSITFIYFVVLSPFLPHPKLVSVDAPTDSREAIQDLKSAAKSLPTGASISTKKNQIVFTKPSLPDDTDDGDPSTELSQLGWVGQQLSKLAYAGKSDAGRASIQRGFFDEIPKVLFILLPLFAVVAKLLYFRQRKYYVEHLVFMLHLHSFAFIILPVMQAAKIGPLQAVFFFGLVVYDFVALRRFYGQSWPVTVLKGGILGSMYVLFLGLGSFLALMLLARTLPTPPPPSKKPAVQGSQPKGANSAQPLPSKVSGP